MIIQRITKTLIHLFFNNSLEHLEVVSPGVQQGADDVTVSIQLIVSLPSEASVLILDLELAPESLACNSEDKVWCWRLPGVTCPPCWTLLLRTVTHRVPAPPRSSRGPGPAPHPPPHHPQPVRRHPPPAVLPAHRQHRLVVRHVGQELRVSQTLTGQAEGVDGGGSGSGGSRGDLYSLLTTPSSCICSPLIWRVLIAGGCGVVWRRRGGRVSRTR